MGQVFLCHLSQQVFENPAVALLPADEVYSVNPHRSVELDIKGCVVLELYVNVYVFVVVNDDALYHFPFDSLYDVEFSPRHESPPKVAK
jgi:hypothetical protein